MDLTRAQKDKLLIFTAALLAERRPGTRREAEPPGGVALITTR